MSRIGRDRHGCHTNQPTLLLAEDDAAVAASFTRFLREHFDVIGIVADGQTLIERADQLRPDLIVADVGLEGLDGIAATIEIRRRYPSIPIVLVTGNMDTSLRPRALAAGASAFLLKAEAVDALVGVLHALLR